jgi:prepilin-type N-terminal cleavage/methylation domain-containing protein
VGGPAPDARDESGFGMLELLIAMIILGVALLALMAAFSSAGGAIARSRNIGAATAVADGQMEIYRGLANCAIWLDSSQIPASGTTYANDATAYNGTSDYSPQIPYWSTSNPADDQLWATDAMDSNNTFSQTNLASCGYTSQADGGLLEAMGGSYDPEGFVTPPPGAVQPVQDVAGPDGTTYPVYTYIVLVKPTNGEWTKQVTVVVRNPRDTSLVLAREVSVFEPATAQ